MSAVLKTGDANARGRSDRILGQIGPDAKEAIPGLTEAAKDPDNTVWSEAKKALNKIRPLSGGPATAVPLFIVPRRRAAGQAWQAHLAPSAGYKAKTPEGAKRALAALGALGCKIAKGDPHRQARWRRGAPAILAAASPQVGCCSHWCSSVNDM